MIVNGVHVVSVPNDEGDAAGTVVALMHHRPRSRCRETCPDRHSYVDAVMHGGLARDWMTPRSKRTSSVYRVRVRPRLHQPQHVTPRLLLQPRA